MLGYGYVIFGCVIYGWVKGCELGFRMVNIVLKC